jgi:mono/diheme cytochrome c family protein
MLRVGTVCVVLLFAALEPALAQSPVERGGYLVNSIMACGNCHTPRDADGKPIADRALSGGGLTLTTPAFVATASNITPDVETGIGGWSDAEIKQALLTGMRPDHGRLAGVPLAAVMPANFYKALLPDDLDAIIAYLRTVKPIRNEITDPVYKAPPHRDPYPDAEAGFNKAMFGDPARRGAYLVTIGHCMECHSAWSRGVSDFKNGLGRGGRRSRHARAIRPVRPAWLRISPRIPSPASAPGPIRKSAAPSPKELRATAGCSNSRWPIVIMPN